MPVTWARGRFFQIFRTTTLGVLLVAFWFASAQIQAREDREPDPDPEEICLNAMLHAVDLMRREMRLPATFYAAMQKIYKNRVRMGGRLCEPERVRCMGTAGNLKQLWRCLGMEPDDPAIARAQIEDPEAEERAAVERGDRAAWTLHRKTECERAVDRILILTQRQFILFPPAIRQRLWANLSAYKDQLLERCVVLQPKTVSCILTARSLEMVHECQIREEQREEEAGAKPNQAREDTSAP